MGIFSRLQDYFQDKTMDAILRRKIIYNAAWEDPRIDGKVLALGEGETIMMLTTGGCNVLDRLLDGVAHIVSVDLNPCQNALLELKLDCMKLNGTWKVRCAPAPPPPPAHGPTGFILA